MEMLVMRKIPEALRLLPDRSNFQELSRKQDKYGKVCSWMTVPMFFGAFLFLGMLFTWPGLPATVVAFVWVEVGFACIALLSTGIYAYFDRRFETIKRQLWPNAYSNE